VSSGLGLHVASVTTFSQVGGPISRMAAPPVADYSVDSG
jgi:hypothetical protein